MVKDGKLTLCKARVPARGLATICAGPRVRFPCFTPGTSRDGGADSALWGALTPTIDIVFTLTRSNAGQIGLYSGWLAFEPNTPQTQTERGGPQAASCGAYFSLLTESPRSPDRYVGVTLTFAGTSGNLP